MHVGVLLTGLQRRNKVHVEIPLLNQCDMELCSNLWLYISEPDSKPYISNSRVSNWVATDVLSGSLM